jgi:dethiobiotin synthetase|tara:strand:- start:5037 stop:5711 length:675 start_codon:yes stop_codon:yes gene_type:complete
VKTLFVTASGTGTGKTYVTAALATALKDKGLSVRALKPVVSGYPGDDAEATDTAILLKSLEIEATQEAVEACSPWRFAEPLSPDMAAKREGRSIDFEALAGFCRDAQAGAGDWLLIEGIGGAMVPLDETHTVLDWMAELGSPVLVVVGSYLGTLSHTLTAVRALESRDIKIAGVVVDESEDSPVPVAETVETLARFLPGVEVAAVARDAGPAAVLVALSDMIGV